jgi:hypothetical protein
MELQVRIQLWVFDLDTVELAVGDRILLLLLLVLTKLQVAMVLLVVVVADPEVLILVRYRDSQDLVGQHSQSSLAGKLNAWL